MRFMLNLMTLPIEAEDILISSYASISNITKSLFISVENKFLSEEDFEVIHLKLLQGSSQYSSENNIEACLQQASQHTSE